MKAIVRMAFVCIVAFAATACSEAPVAESGATTRMIYVDTETKQPVVGNVSTDMPAVNPTTGRRTLMPGLYCPRCQAWRLAPPLEVAQRIPAALRCPQCRSQMIADGHWPSD